MFTALQKLECLDCKIAPDEVHLPAAEAQPEGDGLADLVLGGGAEVVGVVCHGRTVARRGEQIKN